jgi:hypothetical protein
MTLRNELDDANVSVQSRRRDATSSNMVTMVRELKYASIDPIESVRLPGHPNPPSSEKSSCSSRNLSIG